MSKREAKSVQTDKEDEINEEEENEEENNESVTNKEESQNEDEKDDDKSKNNSGEMQDELAEAEEEIKENNNVLNTKRLKLKKVRRKRRSKYDFIGTSYKCPECGKCYLSAPALNAHRKTKHDIAKNEKKGRGRPRKDHVILPYQDPSQFEVTNQLKIDTKFTYFNSESSNEKLEKNFKIFFEKELHKPIPNEVISINFIKELLEINFMDYSNKFCYNILNNNNSAIDSNSGSHKNYNFDRYPFFIYIIDNWDAFDKLNTVEDYKSKFEEAKLIELYGPNNLSNLNGGLIGNNNLNDVDIKDNSKLSLLNIDQVIFIFLKDCSSKTNKEFFELILKFSILIREGYNYIKKNIDYCSNNPIYSFPLEVNNLIELYFQKNYFFGFETGDLVELFTYFCQWLNEHNFSEYKIKF